MSVRKWVWSLALLNGLKIKCCHSWGIGRRCSSHLALLWLWCRPAAAAPIQPLAWELPYVAGVAFKKKKKLRHFILVVHAPVIMVEGRKRGKGRQQRDGILCYLCLHHQQGGHTAEDPAGWEISHGLLQLDCEEKPHPGCLLKEEWKGSLFPWFPVMSPFFMSRILPFG